MAGGVELEIALGAAGIVAAVSIIVYDSDFKIAEDEGHSAYVVFMVVGGDEVVYAGDVHLVEEGDCTG